MITGRSRDAFIALVSGITAVPEIGTGSLRPMTMEPGDHGGVEVEDPVRGMLTEPAGPVPDGSRDVADTEGGNSPAHQ